MMQKMKGGVDDVPKDEYVLVRDYDVDFLAWEED